MGFYTAIEKVLFRILSGLFSGDVPAHSTLDSTSAKKELMRGMVKQC